MSDSENGKYLQMMMMKMKMMKMKKYNKNIIMSLLTQKGKRDFLISETWNELKIGTICYWSVPYIRSSHNSGNVMNNNYIECTGFSGSHAGSCRVFMLSSASSVLTQTGNHTLPFTGTETLIMRTQCPPWFACRWWACSEPEGDPGSPQGCLEERA